MTRLIDIETFFENYDFKEQELVIDKSMKIINVKKYVKSQIHLLKSNRGNKVYLPYYLRLEKVYKIIRYGI